MVSEELRIHGKYGFDTRQERLAQWAKIDQSTNKRLIFVEVDFDQDFFEFLSESLVQQEKKHGCFERLTVQRCRGSFLNQTIQHLLESNAFKELFLVMTSSLTSSSHNNGGRDDCDDSFPFKVLSSLSQRTTTKVILSNLWVTPSCANLLVQAICGRGLQSLALTDCQWDSLGVQTLADGLKSNPCGLQDLEISDGRLMDHDLAMLVDALLCPDYHSQLTRLKLDGNYGQAELLSTLAQIPMTTTFVPLKELDLSHQHLVADGGGGYDDDDEDTDNFLIFLKALGGQGSNPHHMPLLHGLEKLVMRDCNLQDFHLEQFIHVLTRRKSNNDSRHNNNNGSSSLQVLDLRMNRFSSHVIQAVFAPNVSKLTPTLREVYLRQGGGGEMLHKNVRDALEDGLRDNWTLEYLDVFDWDEQIQYYADLNRAGRRLLRWEEETKNNCRSLALWPILLAKACESIGGPNDDDVGRELMSNKNLHNDPSCQLLGSRQQRRNFQRKANVYYYFLRNGPLLWEK